MVTTKIFPLNSYHYSSKFWNLCCISKFSNSACIEKFIENSLFKYVFLIFDSKTGHLIPFLYGILLRGLLRNEGVGVDIFIKHYWLLIEGPNLS